MSCFPWCLTLVCACATLFTSGSNVLHCNMKETWRDLRGLLQWDCPDHKPTTTYTVQKMTQGENRWEAVRGCVQVTSRTCDISRAFAELDLYNWIRLGQEDALGSVRWSNSSMSDPLTKTVYSPPSLSLSLQGLNLTVNVTMACSPIKDCPPRDCCPLSYLVHHLCTSITVYSETHVSRPQTHQKCGIGKVTYEFRGLAPGQRYCAVANFTSSPASFPKCIDLPMETDSMFLSPLWLLGAVFFMLFSTVLVIYCLQQQWASAERRIPRALESLQNGESMELEVPCEEFHEELGGDHISILSQSQSESHCVLTQPTPSKANSGFSIQGDGYRSDPLFKHTGSGQMTWDSEEMGVGLEPSDIPLLPQCIVVPGLSEDLRRLPPQPHPTPVGMVPGPLELPPAPEKAGWCQATQDIPLCSVRMGACEEKELEDTGWFDLTNPSPGGIKL